MRGIAILSLLLLSGCASTELFFTRLADPGGCRLERLAVEPDVLQFAFNGVSPDGRALAVGWEKGKERGAYRLDLCNREKRDLSVLFNNAVSFSPDGRFLIGAVYTPTLRTEIKDVDLKTAER